MLLLVVTCAARNIKPGDGVHIRSAAGAGLDLSVGVEVDDFILSGPFAASVRAVADKDAAAESGIQLFA